MASGAVTDARLPQPRKAHPKAMFPAARRAASTIVSSAKIRSSAEALSLQRRVESELGEQDRRDQSWYAAAELARHLLPGQTMRRDREVADKPLGERIKRLRQERGWSQAQLANRLDVHQEQISGYERGIHVPHTDLLIRIADLFNVDRSL